MIGGTTAGSCAIIRGIACTNSVLPVGWTGLQGGLCETFDHCRDGRRAGARRGAGERPDAGCTGDSLRVGAQLPEVSADHEPRRDPRGGRELQGPHHPAEPPRHRHHRPALRQRHHEPARVRRPGQLRARDRPGRLRAGVRALAAVRQRRQPLGGRQGDQRGHQVRPRRLRHPEPRPASRGLRPLRARRPARGAARGRLLPGPHRRGLGPRRQHLRQRRLHELARGQDGQARELDQVVGRLRDRRR